MRSGGEYVKNEQRHCGHAAPASRNPHQTQNNQHDARHQPDMQPVDRKHMKYARVLKVRVGVRRDLRAFSDHHAGQYAREVGFVFKPKPQGALQVLAQTERERDEGITPTVRVDRDGILLANRGGEVHAALRQPSTPVKRARVAHRRRHAQDRGEGDAVTVAQWFHGM